MMTIEIQTTPLVADGGLDWTEQLDRGVSLDPALRPAFVAHDKGSDNLDRLFTDSALCITSGQQPGLFTGPLYTVYKALSAVSLARRYEAVLNGPVVPVFWIAGDDHDFAEANHFELLATSNEIERLGLEPRPLDAPATPMYQERLGPEIETILERLLELTPDTEFRRDTLAWLARHYHAGNDMAGAFGGALAELLGPSGLVVFHPTHQAAKAVAAPWIVKALECADEVDRELQARARELDQAGRPVPVPMQPGATLVMIDGEQGRDRLVRDGNGFETRRSRESWSLKALRDVAQTAPERLSANVLLRPAVEAALLPTVAYVGGPSELNYFPQTAPVYRALEVVPQRAVPRWSARVVEARVRKTLDRFQITPEDLGAADGQLEGRLVQDGMPAEVVEALERLRASMDQSFPGLVDGAKAIDPTLEKPVEATRHQMASGLQHIEKRLISRLKQHNETLLRQIANARNAIYPHGRPQERVFNILQYLVRYGPQFLREAESACDRWVSDLESSSQGS